MGTCIPDPLEVPSTGRQSFFLFGPRGTGKTTWLKQRFPDAIYLDCSIMPCIWSCSPGHSGCGT